MTTETHLYDCTDCWGIFKMDTSNSDVQATDDPSSKISPWARGEHLRHVEKEILIPKIMRETAKAKCDDFVKAFTQCAKGRTVSVVWSCRKENQAMKDCMASYFQDKDFFEECKKEYLKKREDFQMDYVQSGKTADMKKKESVIA